MAGSSSVLSLLEFAGSYGVVSVVSEKFQPTDEGSINRAKLDCLVNVKR